MTQQTLSIFWRWTIRIAWTSYFIVLMTMTHLPMPARVSDVTSPIDKSLHLVAYGLLAVLTVALFVNLRTFAFPKIRLLFGLIIVAALDEILQGPVGRSADLVDWLFDCAGISLGLIVSQLIIWLIANQTIVWSEPYELKTEN